MKARKVIELIRLKQWVKNSVVFLPLFFGQYLFSLDHLLPTIMAFFSFSFVSSAIYCLNDAMDVEADKRHPKKCKRPIASGAISRRMGFVIGGVCLFLGVLLSILFCNQYNLHALAILGIYLVMNVSYSLGLKNYAILDVFIIALGFVLRVVYGGFSAGIHLSHWIIIMTFLLMLLLAFGKRRDDVLIHLKEHDKAAPRKNTARYNLDFLNHVITLLAAVTIVAYITYTVSDEVVQRFDSPYVYATSIFVLAGIVRYFQLALVDRKSGNPTKILLKDHITQGIIAAWILSFFVIIYL